MTAPDDKKRSKFLSLVLRHDPGKIGLTLDANGWVPVAMLLDHLPPSLHVDRAVLERVVETNDKKRFVLSDDGQSIRAAQGHSVAVDLALTPLMPPEILFHGTAEATLPILRGEGLKPMKRNHVHLSSDEATARKVGMRHGRPAILTVQSGAMYAAGLAFYLSDNGVWLTSHVPVSYIDF